MPRIIDQPLRPFTIFELKAEISLPARALKEPSSLTRVSLDAMKGEGCDLFVRTSRESTPSWVDFLNEGTANRLPPLLNANTAAILFVRGGDRILAYCFGQGRSLLRSDSYETDFGLKVALNSVDVEKLRCLDTRTFEQLTVQTRRQSSKSTPLETFGLNVTHDLLRAVTGEPRDPQLATRLSGRDALTLMTRLSFLDIRRQAEELLALRESTAYQRDFAWVDHLKEERDSGRVSLLDGDLVDRLRRGDVSAMHIAPPEMVDLERISGYSFNREYDVRPDPTLDRYLAALRHRHALQVSMIKRHELHVHVPESDEPVHSWSVYRSLVVESELDDKRYVLTEGKWYAITKQLTNDVRQFMTRFERGTISLPPCKTSEPEEEYNARVAAEQGWACADRQLVKPDGARTPVEFCDLFTPERQLIHVKRRSSSSTLSHLFAQGYVSAEAFLYDRSFREQSRDKVGNLASLIPIKEPNSRDFEIAFAIIGGDHRRWPHSLPFFTQLHFRNTAEKLMRFGYRVTLVHAKRI